jgi:hypothetical protein
MNAKAKAEAIQKLIDSDGWNVVKEEMEKAILLAAYQLADTPSMSVDEMHFRRGAMWAAKKFIALPENVKAILNNEIIMESVSENQDERHGPHN